MKEAMVLVSKEGEEMKAKLHGQIKRLLARNMPPDRFMALALREVSKNEKLMRCSAISVCASIVEAAIMGLEIGSVTGQAYLVPFKDTCQLIVGYKGLILLAWRDARIITHADIIQEADEYEIVRGTNPKITHKPALNVDRGGVVGAYAVFTYPDGRTVSVFHDHLELERRRLRSRAKDSGPWITDTRAMQMKCPIRDGASKFIPFDTAPILAGAANRDDLREAGLGAQFEPEVVEVAAEITGDDPAQMYQGDEEESGAPPSGKGTKALKDRLKSSSQETGETKGRSDPPEAPPATYKPQEAPFNLHPPAPSPGDWIPRPPDNECSIGRDSIARIDPKDGTKGKYWLAENASGDKLTVFDKKVAAHVASLLNRDLLLATQKSGQYTNLVAIKTLEAK